VRRILVVDDDRTNVELLIEVLSKEGHSVQTATDAESTLHRIKAWKPQLLLLDVNLPGVSGLELLPKIRQATLDDYVSIILVTANTHFEDSMLGLDSGADDYVAKPFRAQELLTRVRTMLRFRDVQDALRRANHRIEEISSTDDLTGLMNMRTLHRKGEEEIVRCRRFRKPTSALLINLDHFSEINHQHGFPVGSAVIQEVGSRIKKCLRSIDMASRVGADEFCVLLVETDLSNAEFMGERIRDAIQSEPYKGGKFVVKMTACIGIAGILGTTESGGDSDQHMSDLFHITSEALRSAKAAGPNIIEIYSFA
jgi:diguanylate cyclase (GGDEF)-like protein